MRTLETSIKD